MTIYTADDWIKGALIFDTVRDKRHIPIRWKETEGKVEMNSTWRASIAFSHDFAQPNARDRKLISDAVSPDIHEVMAIHITSDYQLMIPCHICDIDDLVDSGVIEICSVDQSRLILNTRQADST